MQNVILVGFMGCGKSTLGKKLAKKLNIPFIDSDSEIERLEGNPVSEIFAKKGEKYFRKLENDFLLKLNESQNNIPKSFVLSCGGGMPCFYDNIEILNELGKSFYVKLSAFELTRRLMLAKTKRPLIEGKTEEELLLFIKNKLSERSVFYEQAKFILIGKEQNIGSILQKLA